MKQSAASFPTIVLLLLLAAFACLRQTPPTPTPSFPTGFSTHALTHDGLKRSYIIYIPSSYDDARPISLILAFHGGGGNAENQIEMSRFHELADEKGFVVVYPNGTGKLGDKVLTWNGGTCCGYARENNVDDVGFVRELVNELQTSLNIDSRRIYATGMSNGGIMSYRLACEAADLFAAIAPVSGTQNFELCRPSEPVSVIHFHGTADQHLPYDGGVGPKSLTGVNYASVGDSLAFWILRDRCPSRAEVEQSEGITHLAYAPCDSGTSVELYKIEGGGHAWPGADGPGWAGGDEPTQAIDATALIWQFFETHPKP